MAAKSEEGHRAERRVQQSCVEYSEILLTIDKKFGKNSSPSNKKTKSLLMSKGTTHDTPIKPLYKDIVRMAETLGVVQSMERRPQSKSREAEGRATSKERARTAKGFFRRERSNSTNLGLDPDSIRRSLFRNEAVSGIRVKGSSLLGNTMSVTTRTKRRIILTMLKQGKIPLNIVPGYKSLISSTVNEKEKWDKLSESVLNAYDMVIQTNDTTEVKPKRTIPKQKANPLNENNCLLSVKTISMSRSTANKPMSIALVRPCKKIARRENKFEELFKLPADMVNSPINVTINLINKYMALAFSKSVQYKDLKCINALHKRIGLGRAIQNEEELKSYEKVCQLKEKLLRVLYMVINKENNYIPEATSHGRFCVERGNNGGLVKSVLRERHWWTQVEDCSKQPSLLWTPWRKASLVAALSTAGKPAHGVRMYNHLEGSCYLGHKRSMYKCLLLYYLLIGRDIGEVVPLTFHVKNGKKDEEYGKFVEMYGKCAENRDGSRNVWIVKPGENTNRGNGITIANTVAEVNRAISDSSYTYIIQKYIERPLLFEKRKFDIRCFALLTSINGLIKAYYYQEGYLRTSSQDYSVNSFSKAIHLTNEAVQIMYDTFGKHEAGNKVSYAEFQDYLDSLAKQGNAPPKLNFAKDILPSIKVTPRYLDRT